MGNAPGSIEGLVQLQCEVLLWVLRWVDELMGIGSYYCGEMEEVQKCSGASGDGDDLVMDDGDSVIWRVT